MSVLSVRNVLPVVTSIVATLFLATAVPHDLVPEQARRSTVDAGRRRGATLRGRGRDGDACLDEADGKALIERAEAGVPTRRASR